MDERNMYDGYGDIAVEHARQPHNNQPLAAFDGYAKITGPCGDTMEYWIEVVGERIVAVGFRTDGCMSSHAAGSMTSVLAERRTLDEARAITQQDVLNALGGMPEEVQHCALLSSNTLRASCDDYLSRCRTSPYTADDLIEECRDCDKEVCPALLRRANETDEAWLQRQKHLSTLCRIKHKILVLSGKGGVGKSTTAVNLAMGLAKMGLRVGLLDIDLHGPSVAKMLNLDYTSLQTEENRILPAELGTLKVMSGAFLLTEADEAIIWRGPMKAGAIRQFMVEVKWGELDYLIVDAPPGTGDEPLTIAQILADADGAVIVTTPQDVAINSVGRSITFCRNLRLPVLGVIENMSGLCCPECGAEIKLFGESGGRKLAERMGVPFLGAIPLDPAITESGDAGVAFVASAGNSQAQAAFSDITRTLTTQVGESH